MASRGKKKNPAERSDKRETLAAELKDKWSGGSRVFIVALVLLTALLLILSMPFAWNGFVSLSLDGEFSMQASGPLYDIITSGEGGDTQTSQLQIDLPVNPWMAAFAPTFCGNGDTFFIVEALQGMQLEFDRSAGYLENPLKLDAQTYSSLTAASAVTMTVCILLLVAMLALIVVSVLAMTGRVKAKGAFIAALVFTALTVVQFILGMVLCSVKVPSDEGEVRFTPGAFMFLAPAFGAVISAVTGVWAKRCDKDRELYLEIKAELEEK